MTSATIPQLRNPRTGCDCSSEHVSVEFYVTVKDGPRTGWLLGPYATHGEALDEVDRGSKLAEAADPRAHWYAFGTASVHVGTNIRTVFGV